MAIVIYKYSHLFLLIIEVVFAIDRNLINLVYYTWASERKAKSGFSEFENMKFSVNSKLTSSCKRCKATVDIIR